jgi:ketosteroid isomerase-like protein
MRIRLLIPFLALATAGCAAETGDTAEETTAAAEPQEYASNADAASIAAFVNDWQTHYNMGHGTMVGTNFFAEGGLMWSGGQGMAFGAEAVGAMLQGGIDNAGTKLEIALDDQIIRGNLAVARGTYSSEGSIDGQAVGNSGHWMSYQEMIDGEWKVRGLISNIGDGQEAAGFQHGEMPAAVESAAMAAEATGYFVTHFNMGHPDMVADRYAENVVLMGGTLEEGREAIRARLTAMSEAGSQIAITPWAAAELGDDYITSIGTYTITTDGEAVMGHYSNVSRKMEDGTLSTVWSLTSNHPGM